MARIGFIGLGNMGGGMAANLAKAGHDVRAFDLSQEALDRAKQAGCLPVESAAATAEGAEAIVTMLPAGKHVEQVYAEQLFGHAPGNALLLDCSTIDVATAKRVADAAAAKGLVAVDAPDAQVLPQSASARQVDDILRADFPPFRDTPITLAVVFSFNSFCHAPAAPLSCAGTCAPPRT